MMKKRTSGKMIESGKKKTTPGAFLKILEKDSMAS